MSSCHFTAQSLGLLIAFYLVLMALASGVAVPGGLFMPSIMVRPPAFALPSEGPLHAVFVVAPPCTGLRSDGTLHALWCSGISFHCLGKQWGYACSMV